MRASVSRRLLNSGTVPSTASPKSREKQVYLGGGDSFRKDCLSVNFPQGGPPVPRGDPSSPCPQRTVPLSPGGPQFLSPEGTDSPSSHPILLCSPCSFPPAPQLGQLPDSGKLTCPSQQHLTTKYGAKRRPGNLTLRRPGTADPEIQSSWSRVTVSRLARSGSSGDRRARWNYP